PCHRLGGEGDVCAMTTAAEQYRNLAWDCLKLAEGTSNGDTRASMLDLAQRWLRLAEQSERTPQYQRAGYRAKHGSAYPEPRVSMTLNAEPICSGLGVCG